MDKEFLIDQSQWPNSNGMRYCCLKKEQENAFILSCDNPTMTGEIIVSLGIVFDGGTGETVAFDSVDDLLKDGWIVD